MDMHTPRNEDDLSDLERRLSGWRPGADGLDADAMLFAAGLAARRRGRGRFLVPALCGLLAIASVGLGAWGWTERAERQILAQLLDERLREPSVPPALAVPVPSESSYTLSPVAYLRLRRQMEEDPNRWLASLPLPGAEPLEPPPPQPDIFRVGQSDRLFAQ